VPERTSAADDPTRSLTRSHRHWRPIARLISNRVLKRTRSDVAERQRTERCPFETVDIRASFISSAEQSFGELAASALHFHRVIPEVARDLGPSALERLLQGAEHIRSMRYVNSRGPGGNRTAILRAVGRVASTRPSASISILAIRGTDSPAADASVAVVQTTSARTRKAILDTAR
jgi:hypothetical protein